MTIRTRIAGDLGRLCEQIRRDVRDGRLARLEKVRAEVERARNHAQEFARANPEGRAGYRLEVPVAKLVADLENALDNVLAVVADVDVDVPLGTELYEPVAEAIVAALRFADVVPRRGTRSQHAAASRTLWRAKDQLDGFHQAAPLATARLLDTAIWVLPAAHRSRYDEEFRGQLAELPRRARVIHAWRLTSRSWLLRRALTERPPASGVE
jgi:hypothetical protein